MARFAFYDIKLNYDCWFYTDFLKKRIEKKKQEKLSEKSVPAESANENKEA